MGKIVFGFITRKTNDIFYRTTPAAPSFPDQLQSAIENHHHPPEVIERPISVASSNHNSNMDNIHEMVASIHRYSPGKTSLSQQIPIIDTQLNNHLSTIFQSHNEDDDDININQPLNTFNPQRTRQASNTDSIQSGISDPTSRRSPITPILNNIQPRLNVIPIYHQQDDKISSSSRRSSERFPPPPQNIEILPSPTNGIPKQRTTSSLSYRSSVNDDLHEQLTTPEVSYFNMYNLFKSFL
jgi:hypothetical protein